MNDPNLAPVRCSLIAALSENGVIGQGGGLPWRLSADLRRFKAITMGHHVIMGRKTFAAIGRTLPGRTMIVLTRQADFAAPAGVLVARNLHQALQLAAGDDEVLVVGGGEIYRQALPLATRIYLTLVHAHLEGDTRFPELDPADWCEVESTWHAADEKNQYDTTFRILERV